MALKGHTKIELHNVKTGEDHIIESDNLVTNFAKELYGRLPIGNSSDAVQYFTRPIDNAFGGILLFKDPIEENPNKYKIPYGSYMVGNGTVDYASATATSELGAYNAEESTFTRDDDTGTCIRKYVYDFSTSKANGTISSICLTNPYVGYWGFGNRSGNSEMNMHSSWDTMKDRFSKNSYYAYERGITNAYILFGDYLSDTLYAYLATGLFVGRNLELYRCTLMCNRLNLFNALPSSLFVNKKITIPLPDTIPVTPSKDCAVGFDDAYVYILIPSTSTYSINNNATFYIWGIKYDLSDTVTYTMTNKTGYTIRGGFVGDGAGLTNFCVKDGYMVVATTAGRLFKIKLSDPTDVTELLTVSGDIPYTALSHGNRIGFEWVADSPLCYRSVSTGSDFQPRIIDLENNKVYPLNGRPIKSWSSASSSSWAYTSGNVGKIFNSSIYYSSRAHNDGSVALSQRFFSRDPFMLSTINNLDEPVTKTSDMTMKITYTLTGAF